MNLFNFEIIPLKGIFLTEKGNKFPCIFFGYILPFYFDDGEFLKGEFSIVVLDLLPDPIFINLQ